MWTIYCHTLVFDGRRYVGQTKNSWQRRWRSHVVAALRVTDGYGHFANAIRKYGSEAFSHEVLEICDTQTAADLAEKHWIALFDTMNRELGFNRQPGGQGDNNAALRRSKNMPEVRAKVSTEVSALWADPSIRASRSAAIAAGREANPRTPESLLEAGKKRSATAAKARAERTHFDCSVHDHILLADCYKKTVRGMHRYECKKCVLAAQKIVRDTFRAAHPLVPKTTHRCKVHGEVPTEQCYGRFEKKTGKLVYRCKVCVLAGNRRWSQKLPS